VGLLSGVGATAEAYGAVVGFGTRRSTVMSGTVGGDERLEYVAIGDTTNVAARLEAMTKATDGGLLVADSTRSRLSSGAEHLQPGGQMPVRGRSEGVAVWTLPVGGDGRPREGFVAEDGLSPLAAA